MKTLPVVFEDKLRENDIKPFKRVKLYPRTWDSTNRKYTWDTTPIDLIANDYLISISPISWNLDKEGLNIFKSDNFTLKVDNSYNIWNETNPYGLFYGKKILWSKISVEAGLKVGDDEYFEGSGTSFSASKITMKQQDSGTETAGGSKYVITDSSKSWTTNQFAGMYLKATSGDNSGVSMLIYSNTATTIDLVFDFPYTFDIGDTFEIYPSIFELDELVNRHIEIKSGTGEGQERKVASNDEHSITLETNWDITPAADTCWIIRGEETLAEYTGLIDEPIDEDPNTKQANISVLSLDVILEDADAEVKAAIKELELFYYDDTKISCPANNQITYTGAGWTADEHIGKYVWIVHGTGVTQKKLITDNSTDTLTISGTWTTNPDLTSDFIILQMEVLADIYSSTTIGNTTMGWPVNQFQNKMVKIIEGTGAGQYRKITSNTATTLTVPAWTTPIGLWDTSWVVPDATSRFIIEGETQNGNGILTDFLTTYYGVSKVYDVYVDSELQTQGIDYSVSQINDKALRGKIVFAVAPLNLTKINIIYRRWFQDQTINWLIEFLLISAGIDDYNLEVATMGNISNFHEDDSKVNFDAGQKGMTSDSGTADVIVDNTHLKDTDKVWVNDQWIDLYIKIWEGTSAGDVRLITDNDSNTLTVSPAFSSSPDNTSKYVIFVKTTESHADGYIYSNPNDYDPYLSEAGSPTWRTLPDLGSQHWIQDFEITSSDTGAKCWINKVKLYLKKIGSPTSGVIVEIRKFSGGDLVWGYTCGADDISSGGGWVEFGQNDYIRQLSFNTLYQIWIYPRVAGEQFQIASSGESYYWGRDYWSASEDIAFGIKRSDERCTFESRHFDSGVLLESYGKLFFESNAVGTYKAYTRTAPDSTGVPGTWESWQEISSQSYIQSTVQRWIQYRIQLIRTSWNDSPVIYNVSIEYLTSEIEIELANFTGKTNLAVIEDLAKIPDFEIGFDSDSAFFFRNKEKNYEPDLKLKDKEGEDKNELNYIQSVKSLYKDYSRVYNIIQAVYGDYKAVKDSITEGETRPNSKDKYGEKVLSLSFAGYLTNAKVSIAESSCQRYFDRYKDLKFVTSLVLTYLPHLELADILQVSLYAEKYWWKVGDTIKTIGDDRIYLYDEPGEILRLYQTKFKIIGISLDLEKWETIVDLLEV